MLRLLSTFLRTFSWPPVAGSQPCPGLLLTESVIPNGRPACLCYSPKSHAPFYIPTCPPAPGSPMPHVGAPIQCPLPLAVRCLPCRWLSDASCPRRRLVSQHRASNTPSRPLSLAIKMSRGNLSRFVFLIWPAGKLSLVKIKISPHFIPHLL